MLYDEVESNIGFADNVVSEETAELSIAYLLKLPEEAWKHATVPSRGGGRKKPLGNRIGLGRPHQPPVPPILKQLGNEAWDNALKTEPDFPNWDLFSPDTIVVNRYDPGQGVGFHKDPPRQNAFIMGVTLYESEDVCPMSNMKFKHDDGGKVTVVPTPHRSAYLVTGAAYHAAKHSRAASKRQVGRVYSVTFRAERQV